MIKLILLRHGLTEWNAEKRIQGQIDNPLSEQGVEQVKMWQLPVELRRMVWYTSPMRRARETAELLGINNPVVEPALLEMHWGDWEGEILKPLRKRLGDAMRDKRRSRSVSPPPSTTSWPETPTRPRSPGWPAASMCSSEELLPRFQKPTR